MKANEIQIKRIGLCLSVAISRSINDSVNAQMLEENDPLWLKRQKSKSLRPKKR